MSYEIGLKWQFLQLSINSKGQLSRSHSSFLWTLFVISCDDHSRVSRFRHIHAVPRLYLSLSFLLNLLINWSNFVSTFIFSSSKPLLTNLFTNTFSLSFSLSLSLSLTHTQYPLYSTYHLSLICTKILKHMMLLHLQELFQAPCTILTSSTTGGSSSSSGNKHFSAKQVSYIF